LIGSTIIAQKFANSIIAKAVTLVYPIVPVFEGFFGFFVGFGGLELAEWNI
jgi:hypothetical protein